MELRRKLGRTFSPVVALAVASGLALVAPHGPAGATETPPPPGSEPVSALTLGGDGSGPGEVDDGTPIGPPGARIVGGYETSIERYPWQVLITANGQPFCGGSLVHPRLVLSAGHCFRNQNNTGWLPYTFAVHTGRTMTASGGETHQVADVYLDGAQFGVGPLRYDWALVVLPVAVSSIRKPIEIAGPGERSLWRTGRVSEVTGYGHTTQGGQSSDRLRAVGLPVLADTVCGAQSAYGFNFQPASMLCAGYVTGGKDACQGDSGGPLAVRMDGGYRLAGVVSWGDGCAKPGYPGIYTRVAEPAMSARIQQLARQAADDYNFPGVESGVSIIGSGGVPVGCTAARGAAAKAKAAQGKAAKKAKKAKKKFKKAKRRVTLLRKSGAKRAAVAKAAAKQKSLKKKQKKAAKKVKGAKKRTVATAAAAARTCR